MNIRVTNQVQVAATLANLRRQSSTQAKFQDQIVSGFAVKAASDNPLNFAMLARAREAATTLATSMQVASEASNSVEAGVSALVDNNKILGRAKQLVIAANNPDSTPTSDEANAQELDQLINRFLQNSNSQIDGRYLFGGDNTTTPPFRVAATNSDGKPTSIVYEGSVTPASAEVGGQFTVETGSVGSGIFQSPTANAFQSLISFRDTLRNTALTPTERSDALTRHLAEFEAAESVLSSAIGAKSGSASGLEAIQSRLQDQRIASLSRADELGATDYTEAILRFKQEESAYQATLNVAAKLVPPSLFDLIR